MLRHNYVAQEHGAGPYITIHNHTFSPTEEEEVVKPILFLLSEQSSMINCVTMSVDGGFTAC